MTSDADRFWDGVARKLRRAKGFLTPTPEEAEAELYAVGEEPLTDKQIDAMMKAAISEKLEPYTPMPDLSWLGIINDSYIDQGLLVLNRNRGDEDKEVDELLEKQRREALEDDEHHPGGKESGGSKSGRKAPGDGG